MAVNEVVKEIFQEQTRSWKHFPPSLISDLFYYKDDKGEQQRYYSFILSEEDTNILRSLDPENISAIRFFLACAYTDSIYTFNPWIGILYKNETEDEFLFELQLVDASALPIWYQGIITPGTADLFRLKWLEIGAEKINYAFAGKTFKKFGDQTRDDPDSLLPTNQRVKFYHFGKDDVHDIINNLQNTSKRFYLHLGAGLQVDIFHPYNFRPVIEVGRLRYITPGSEDITLDGDDDDNYYERAQPCPPYCHGGGDGEP